MNKPTIETLVEDIYKLFDGNHVVQKKNAKELSNSITSILIDRFSKMGEDRRTLRLSMIGKPLRQIWYELKGYPKEEIPAYTKIKFLYGDILEALLLFLAKEAGHIVEEEQKEIIVEGVKGHQDARVDGVLIDVKSASSYNFKKFRDGTLLNNDPFHYAEQLAAYMQDKNDKRAGWLAIDKTLGHLALHLVHDMELPNVVKKISDIKNVLTLDTPPEKCFKPVPEGVKGNLILGTECSYCPFKEECWKDSNEGKGLRTFMTFKGPKYFVEIVSNPKLTEITNATEDTNQENEAEAAI